MNISELLALNGHIKANLNVKTNLMNYATLEPVLFEKLYNIKLS